MFNLKFFISLLFSALVSIEVYAIDFSFSKEDMAQSTCELVISRFRKSDYKSYAQIQIDIEKHSKSKSEVREHCKDLMLSLRDIDALIDCNILESKYPGYIKKSIPAFKKMKQVFSAFYNRECKIYEKDIETENWYKSRGKEDEYLVWKKIQKEKEIQKEIQKNKDKEKQIQHTNTQKTDVKYYKVTHIRSDDTLNVRAGTGTMYPVIAELSPNQENIVVVVCENGSSRKSSTWCLIRVGNIEGWVSKRYITIQQEKDKIIKKGKEKKLSNYTQIKTYKNSKYGFSFEYPSVLLNNKIPLEGYTGVVLRDNNWTVSVIANASRVKEFNSAKEMYESALSSKIETNEVTYKKQKNNWYVLSGYNYNYKKIFYEKYYFINGVSYGYTISYPKKDKKIYDKLMRIVTKSFTLPDNKVSVPKKQKPVLEPESSLSLEAANDTYYKQGNDDITAYKELAKTNVLAKAQLAKMYYLGKGTSKNITLAKDLFKEVIPSLKAKAKEGNLFAQYLYAYYLAHGLGMQKDIAQAAKWYKVSAYKGFHVSQNNLANLYKDDVIEEDEDWYEDHTNWDEAEILYKKSAKQGNKIAADNLKVLDKEREEYLKSVEMLLNNSKQVVINYIKAFKLIDSCIRPSLSKKQRLYELKRSIERYNSCIKKERKGNIEAFKEIVLRYGGGTLTWENNTYKLSNINPKFKPYVEEKFEYLNNYLRSQSTFVKRLNTKLKHW